MQRFVSFFSAVPSSSNGRPVIPLEVNLLREVINPAYVEWINQNIVDNWYNSTLKTMLNIRKLGGILRRLSISNPVNKQSEAYIAYTVLLPIENLLRRRSNA